MWIDKNGKQVIIRTTKHDFYDVSVLDINGQPYQIKLLNNQTKNTTGLTGLFTKDINGNPILQVEAGTIEIGPTYNLYFLAIDSNQKTRLAKNSDSLEKIIIKPNVGIGLYDNWDDDFGVAWAYPLEDLVKK